MDSQFHNDLNQSVSSHQTAAAAAAHATSTSILNTSFNKSTCFYKPIINEIFTYKLNANKKTEAFNSLLLSALVCLLSFFLLNINDHQLITHLDSLFNTTIFSNNSSFFLILFKLIVFSLFLLFFINILNASWLLATNMLNTNTQILNEQLNVSQKKLLGVSDVDNYNKKQSNYQQQQSQQHQLQHQSDSIQTPSKSINLPPFFLTSSQKRVIYDDAVASATFKDDYIPTTTGSPIYSSLNNSIKVSPTRHLNNESINLSEKYVDKFIKEIEEHEKQQLYGAVLTNGAPQLENSFVSVDDTLNNSGTINRFLNYQQKQLSDRFIELRNYQYQVGTKSVSSNNNFNYYEQLDYHTQLQQSSQQQLSPLTNKFLFQISSIANNEVTTQSSANNKAAQVKSEPGTGSVTVNNGSTTNTQTEPSSQKSDQSFRSTQDEQQTHLYRRSLSTKQLVFESPIDTIDQLWCKKFGINRIKLDLERENIRKWLSKTILKPIVSEIEKLNEILNAIGCLDMKIGQASVAQLVEFLKTPKSQLLPNLQLLVPYLEQTSHQDYLVQRLKELSMTSVISDYFWDGGGYYKNKDWSDYLPTDGSILMSCFCTYMNSRLVPHPRYAINKPFTMQYYFKNTQINQTTNSNSTNMDQQLSNHQPLNANQRNELTSLYLYECKGHPPIYKVIYNKEIFDIATGRNNIFDAILCFLHIAKTELKSMLGPVCLDSTGINISCVIE